MLWASLIKLFAGNVDRRWNPPTNAQPLSSAYLELTDIRSSIEQVPATALTTELF
jgi:hypothetical protein